MKNKRLILIIAIISVFLTTACSDDKEPAPTPPIANKTLAMGKAECLMFKSINGSKEGGVDGLEIEKYRERHLRKMNSLIFNLDDFVEESFITFIEGTDSVKINGYVDCGYSDVLFYVTSANNKVFKYKFEDNALKVQYDPKLDNWLTLGYGNKEKIDVYIETKIFSVGSMPLDPDYENPLIEDKYVWEISGTSGLDINISIAPEQANTLVENKNWQDFFDDISANWINIPAGKYYAETFKSAQDMKFKFQGGSWSIYKMTYLPETTEE